MKTVQRLRNVMRLLFGPEFSLEKSAHMVLDDLRAIHARSRERAAEAGGAAWDNRIEREAELLRRLERIADGVWTLPSPPPSVPRISFFDSWIPVRQILLEWEAIRVEWGECEPVLAQASERRLRERQEHIGFMRRLNDDLARIERENRRFPSDPLDPDAMGGFLRAVGTIALIFGVLWLLAYAGDHGSFRLAR